MTSRPREKGARGSGLAPLRPRSALFTLYGDYAYPHGSDLWLGSLVQLTRTLGITEVAVRSAVARLAREGWIVSRKQGNRSFYGLSETGRGLIEEGTRRIYERRPDWNGRWCLLAYSIPESRRAHRDRIRKQLAWLGFGALGGGTYASPRDVATEVQTLIAAHGVGAYSRVFSARFEGPGSDAALARQCWDLASIAKRYDAFIAHYAPLYRRDLRRRRSRTLPDREAFIVRFLLTHDFRRFPFIDPELPASLLPAHWAGASARELFEKYHGMLTDGAIRYFTAIAGVKSRPILHPEWTRPRGL